jgi:hypothetical protein
VSNRGGCETAAIVVSGGMAAVVFVTTNHEVISL